MKASTNLYHLWFENKNIRTIEKCLETYQKRKKNNQAKEHRRNFETEWPKNENEILNNLVVKVIPDEMPCEVISDDEGLNGFEVKEYLNSSDYLHQDPITVEKHEIQFCTEQIESYSDEFHKMKMKNLKEEHENRMLVLEEEHAYWRDMRSKM